MKADSSGQQIRLEAFVTIGNYSGHVGLGIKGSEGDATAIGAAVMLARLPAALMQQGS